MKRAADEVLVIDGAMGTMLSRMGLPAGEPPELLNVTAPEMIAEVHKNYVLAGAHAISTNSFGGSRPKLDRHGIGDQVGGLNRAAVRIARATGAQHILADVGPTGLVLEPLGSARFDDVYGAFHEQIEALAAEHPDAIFLETFTDIAEARCALLAARAVTDIPVLVSMSYGVNGRTELSGTDPETAAVILESLGAAAIGMNCGLGPDQMLPLVARLAAATTLPVIAQPNAGMPRLEGGATVFPGTPVELGLFAEAAADAGATFVGSCCGSSPSFTSEIVMAVEGRAPRRHGPVPVSGAVRLASSRALVVIGGGTRLKVIGERINPTGKKALADSLREGSMAVVREFAVAQEREGADLLDVNVGAAGVDATATLPVAVASLAPLTDLPLVIDTTDLAALEAAARLYPGRALINSVNGAADSIASVLPVAVRYGAAVIVLALDDDGIPDTAERRLAIVDRVRDAARLAGLSDADLVVDGLVLTAASEPEGVHVALDTLRGVHERGLATVLGVSNVSHGLPGRPQLNAAFLAMARGAGLDAAIVNPADGAIMAAIAATDALTGCDDLCAGWISRVRAEEAARAAAAAAGPAPAASARAATPAAAPTPPADPAARLVAAIESGDVDSAPALVDELITMGVAPGAVIGDVMTPAIKRLGDAYGRGEVFLPQMMVAAEAMKAGVRRAKEYLPAEERGRAGRVVFATVKGDIHSIGKDICVSLLESRGIVVDDLGVDVPAETVAAAAADADTDVVCLSALMTTTLPAMEATVAMVAAQCPGVPVLVGGAVVTPEWAASVGAGGYAPDAPGCVELVSGRIEGGKVREA
jgi:5-methyltetrahydrofolate--homocysteine methyltransferase